MNKDWHNVIQLKLNLPHDLAILLVGISQNAGEAFPQGTEQLMCLSPGISYCLEKTYLLSLHWATNPPRVFGVMF
jgi:hypothetical protein